MNERIKELLKQATFDALYETQDAVNCLDNSVAKQQRELQLKKFAELIVREMCSVLDKAQWDKGEDWICADGTRIIP